MGDEPRAKVFKTNRSQAVRLPKAFAFPDGVKEVTLRRDGDSVVMTPRAAKETFDWDAWFAEGDGDFPYPPPQGMPGRIIDFD